MNQAIEFKSSSSWQAAGFKSLYEPPSYKSEEARSDQIISKERRRALETVFGIVLGILVGVTVILAALSSYFLALDNTAAAIGFAGPATAGLVGSIGIPVRVIRWHVRKQAAGFKSLDETPSYESASDVPASYSVKTQSAAA